MKTDAQLQQDVITELAADALVHADQIFVGARDGVVTLSGEVGCSEAQSNLQSAVLRVPGVAALAIELEAGLSALDEPCNAITAESAQREFEWAASMPVDSIEVLFADGWTTLADAAGHSDRVALMNQASEVVVKSDIEVALNRRAMADAREISVQLNGADVTLTGTVHSWAERDLATHSAWASPGVRNVVDQLTLVY